MRFIPHSQGTFVVPQIYSRTKSNNLWDWLPKSHSGTVLNGFTWSQVRSRTYMYMHRPLTFSSCPSGILTCSELGFKYSAAARLDCWAPYEIIQYTSDIKENLSKHNIRQSKYLVLSSWAPDSRVMVLVWYTSVHYKGPLTVTVLYKW